MDSNINNDKTPSLSEQNKDESLPVLQINPLTLMTSLSPYKPVDDNQENILDSTYVNRSQSIDVSTSFDQINNQKPLSIAPIDGNSIAAWVKSTTNESLISPIERSPSLPATIIEQIITRSRRESTVSTLCDQQQQQQQIPAPSDTMSSTISQNLSFSNDYQRSFSFPLVDQHQHNENNEDIRFIQDENDDDFPSQFLPALESEDSEIDKKTKKLQSPEEPIKFNNRSVDDDQPIKSSSVSFHASVSFETHRKLLPNHQRHHSWNKTKNKSFLYQRSHSHKIHSQIINKSFLTSCSMPAANYSSPHPDNQTNQSSSYSDNVFLSTSTTNSPSLSQHLHLTNHTPICSQFLSIPSSASLLSSNISDASGQSGIESTNLRTSASELPRTASIIEEEINDEKNLYLSKQRTSSVSSGSSRTASTESLPTSSSENEGNNFQKKLGTLNKFLKISQTPADQRLDVVRQLMWLLEKRSTINPRLNLGRRKNIQGTSSVNTIKLILISSFLLF
jgi:hypothetical protein